MVLKLIFRTIIRNDDYKSLGVMYLSIPFQVANLRFVVVYLILRSLGCATATRRYAEHIEYWITSGTFTVRINGTVYDLAFNFRTDDKKDLTGSFTGQLPYIDESVDTTKFPISKKFLRAILRR